MSERVELDPSARRIDDGRVLVGGTPLRVLRLTDAGAQLLDRLVAGAPVPAGAGARRLVRRLVDGGVLHPRPSVPGTLRSTDVAAVIPVRGDDPSPARAAAAGAAEIVVVADEDGDGPAAARNRGWRPVRADVVAFLDADTAAAPGWLEALLAHLDDPSVGAVAPRVRTSAAGAPAWLSAYEAVRSPLDLGPLAAPVRPGSRVPYVPTAALLVRRAALEDVGGFDESLRVGEDVDLVWRLHAAGWRVRYEPTVEVRHPSRSTLAAWARQRFRYGTSAAPLAERHGAAVAPLGISGWSAAAWALVLLGRPVAGLAVGAGTTAALAPKLRGLRHPAREAVRIAGVGNLYAGRAAADALRRPWWPLALLLGWRVRRTRPALLAAATVPALLEWREQRPRIGGAQFVALRLLDDVAYGAGLWAGCARARSTRALRPVLAGPFPPPQPADEAPAAR